MSLIIKIISFINVLICIHSNYSNNETLNCYSDSILPNNFGQNVKLSAAIQGGPLAKHVNLIKEEFLKFVASMYNYELEVEDQLYDLIVSLDEECFNLILNFFFKEIDFVFDITSRVLHNGGIIQYSIGTEEDCLNEDGVYMLFTGEFNLSELRLQNKTKSKESIFREAKYAREEVCIFKQCRHTYVPFLEYLFKYQVNSIKSLFQWSNFKIGGINFKGIEEKDKVQKTKEEREKEEKEKKYYDHVVIVLIVLSIFFITFSIISWIMRECDIKFYSNGGNFLGIKELNPGFLDNEEDENEKEEIGTQIGSFSKSATFSEKEQTCEDLIIYKIISSFDLVKNLSLLNREEEPLYNQKNLIELSTIKLFTIFFIMLGENCYIILKYVENKMSILSFCKDPFFFVIQLGMNSYETYKIICGILFGFKFMSFYDKNKEEKTFRKRMWIFLTKPIPYIIMFYVIHFLFNYPIFIYVRQFFGNARNTFLSSIMEECSCQKDPYNLVKIIPIMIEYNSTEFNQGQYNGCSRPILFSLSEFFCFSIVFIIAVINVYWYKNNFINILYIILLIVIFIFLSFIYFFLQEVKDLNDEYKVSRLFGLSSSIAQPQLFLPLYYIGFNIGIIYYYRINFSENKFVMDEIPFKYCYDINKIITSISGRVRNIFMFIFISIIIFLSFSFSFLLKTVAEDEFLFTFKEKPVAKFIYVYKGTIQGIFFAFFILFYLCSGNSFLKVVLSSEFFNFFHKISFSLFISFYSILNFFHAIGIMEIYLMPFSVFTNTLILFVISCLLSIIFTCVLFFPIKKLYLYTVKGFYHKDFEEKLNI